MVVVDRFIKMGHFIGLEEKATARDVAAAFHREVWKYHELHIEIIADMDAKFARDFWESLFKKLGIKQKMSTAYHPQTNGQMEKLTKCWEATSAFSSTMIRMTGTTYSLSPNSPTTTRQPVHTE